VQIQFSNAGKFLIVSARGASMKGIKVYGVDAWGATTPVQWYEMDDHQPFGFDIDQWDRVFLAEVPMNSLSTWQINWDGTLTFIDRKDTMQQGTCWATLTPNGMWAYVANAGSSSVSGFWADKWAHLTSVSMDGVTAKQTDGVHTQDLTTSGDGKYLYTLTHGTVYAYWVGNDGKLSLASWYTDATWLPDSVTGLLAPMMMQGKMPKDSAMGPAGKKNAIIGGIMGGVGAGLAIFVVRRRRSQKAKTPAPVVEAIKTLSVHV